MSEQWRPVVGYEGRYEVSDQGRVRCVSKFARVPYRKFYPGAHHMSIRIVTGGRPKFYLVHVLVCEAFHGPKPKWAECARHLNDDGHDNRAENLAWGTFSQNNHDAVRNGRHPMARRTACANGHPFVEGSYWLEKGNSRRCRQCSRDEGRRRSARKKAAVTTPGD